MDPQERFDDERRTRSREGELKKGDRQMNFGLNLKLARTAAGLTQAELADKLGIAQKQLSRYERNEQTPSVTLATQIADVLGIDMNTLTKKEIIKMKFTIDDFADNRRRMKIAPDDAPENFRYLVQETKGSDWSIYSTPFLTLEDANAYASGQWNHLTALEKKRDKVDVVYVEKTTDYYLQEDLDSEDWEWSCWMNADSPEGGFDSSELEGE